MSDSGKTTKYPSDEIALQMIVTSLGPEELVRKACDWQRERDALICKGEFAKAKKSMQTQPESPQMKPTTRPARTAPPPFSMEAPMTEREALREIVEIFAGMEGVIPETAPEGYQQRIINQMYAVARDALAAPLSSQAGGE